ncbi:hypothetical protein OU535_01135, partial [Escherichia coli]|nr:hypothetical protein [Escherichia coli]MDF8722786.1 hypothetical protein [Escherichia coli]MDF8738260.1 hypothetical protein [Escherichia coli]MDF8750441.1 hypothetical protein [Escherichia coli]MDF8936166.1 hypothetical protein [Escherichia coli]
SLKTSIKTITYLSDIGCLEIQGASLKPYPEHDSFIIQPPGATPFCCGCCTRKNDKKYFWFY